jgi:hypothetical protein
VRRGVPDDVVEPTFAGSVGRGSLADCVFRRIGIIEGIRGDVICRIGERIACIASFRVRVGLRWGRIGARCIVAKRVGRSAAGQGAGSDRGK